MPTGSIETGILTKLLQMDGEFAILCAVLFLLLLLLWRENRRLQDELSKAQQARVDDAKEAAEAHVELVDRLRNTTEGTSQALNSLKDLFVVSARRGGK